MISIIVAASTTNVIGVQGELPWRLSNDLKRFKKITMGKPIVMGRLTYESIGRPLPGRQNIIITRQTDFTGAGCDVVASPEAARAAAGDVEEIMIIGGGEIYALFLPLADRIYLTRVHTEISGDAFFPQPEDSEWRMSASEKHGADASHALDYSFETWDRIS